MVAYQTAYLKAHYPIEFMAALITSEKNDVERVGYLIGECKNMGIEVLAPDINESFYGFTVIPGAGKNPFWIVGDQKCGRKHRYRNRQQPQSQRPVCRYF
jgi:DNA polymerase III, alpha subunit (EC 2.7.7.7)